MFPGKLDKYLLNRSIVAAEELLRQKKIKTRQVK